MEAAGCWECFVEVGRTLGLLLLLLLVLLGHFDNCGLVVGLVGSVLVCDLQCRLVLILYSAQSCMTSLLHSRYTSLLLIATPRLVTRPLIVAVKRLSQATAASVCRLIFVIVTSLTGMCPTCPVWLKGQAVTSSLFNIQSW